MKKGMDVKKKSILCISVLSILAVVFVVLIWPSIYDHQCKNRRYNDMADSLAAVENSNIRIIAVTGNEDEGVGYSASASGVIINHEGNRYYALTAKHVVDKSDVDHYIVATTLTPTYKEYKEEKGLTGHVPLPEYYALMPEVVVEYKDDSADLAIISFQYSKELTVADLASENPQKGNRIVAAGSPNDVEGGFVHSFGKITSAEEIIFEANDGRAPDKVLKHNAYEEPGSSGGAIFSEQMQVVGINIGGGRDMFNRFRYGVMIPVDQISECISNWEELK